MPNTSAAERCYDLAAQVPHPTAGPGSAPCWAARLTICGRWQSARLFPFTTDGQRGIPKHFGQT